MLNDKFVSAIFCAPTGEYENYPSRLTDEVFAALKNMGINRIFGYGFDSRAETVERTFELCEKYGILYFEELTAPHPDLLSYVHRQTGIPVASGERIYSRWQFQKHL